MRIFALMTIGTLFTLGAASSGTSQELSPATREAVVQEIRRTMDDYKDAVMRKDLRAQLTFWSDSENFVFAGDGNLLNHGEWSAQLGRYNDETDRWLYMRGVGADKARLLFGLRGLCS